MAFPVNCANLNSIVENGAFSSREEARHAAQVRLTIMLRHNGGVQGKSNSFRRAPAEHGFRLGVPVSNSAGCINSDKCIVGCGDDFTNPFPAGPKLSVHPGKGAANHQGKSSEQHSRDRKWTLKLP